MDANFWHHVWHSKQLGFQLDAPHPLLSQFIDRFAAGRTVFIPLCGKSPDIACLASRGPVIGSELSAVACHEFFEEIGLLAQQRTETEHTRFAAENMVIWQGDFFKLTQAMLGECDLIYDRAALIALPPLMQQEYVTKLTQLLPHATMWCISLDYPQAEKVGPPFSVTAERIRELFPFAEISLMAELDLTGQGFARRRFQTSFLKEQLWQIRW